MVVGWVGCWDDLSVADWVGHLAGSMAFDLVQCLVERMAYY